MRDKLQQWMYGRYGIDDLNKFLLYISIALIIINMFFRNSILNTLTLVLLIFCYFRMFSKNHSKRYDENVKFLNLKNKILTPFQNHKFGSKHTNNTYSNGTYSNGTHVNTSTTNTSIYKVFRCPGCKQKVRVPKGKGKVSICCPKCGKDFIKRT